MQTLDLSVGDVALDIAAIHAVGSEPVVFLHGFGSTKEEYADFTCFPRLAGRPLLANDAPGFGRSTASDLTTRFSSRSSSTSRSPSSTGSISTGATSWGTPWVASPR